MVTIASSAAPARRRQHTRQTLRRLAHGALAVAVVAVGLTAVNLTGPSPDVATAAPPGNPGVPFTPPVLYEEGFENGVNDTPISLTDYTAANFMTYTADKPWLVNCNGVILNFNSPPGAYLNQPLNSCQPWVTGTDSNALAYQRLQAEAYAIGMLNGQSSPASNHAVAAYTHNANPGANKVQFRTSPDSYVQLPTATGRFVTFSVDTAATNCDVSGPLYNFSLLESSGQSKPVGGQIVACEGGHTVLTPGGYIYVSNKASDGSVLLNGSSLGIIMTNANGSGAGNDASFDNIRVLDVTPQLDKSFAPATIKMGESSALTFTVTGANTGTAVSGWDFTDNLPAGLQVANVPNVRGTCSAATTATPGATSIKVTNGSLATNEMSCTITVDVTPQSPKGAEASPVVYQNCAANFSGVKGIDLPNCATLTVTSEPKLTITKTSDAGQNARVGQTVKYAVKVKNTGTADFTAQHQASLTDDLSDVLDDATYNNDAAVSFDQGTTGAAPTVASGKLSWLGSLKAGETATFTYSVTLTNTGNGTVRNTACIPPADAATAENCATTQTRLPKLTIVKASDVTDLPKTGGIVTYTVIVTNEGPGDATAENPATLTDDLADVLDDGTFVDDSLSASNGTPSRNGTKLSWSGPLMVGASAKITYRVTYDAKKGGSHELINTACLPEAMAQDPQNACSTVKLPGAALQQWKTSDPKPGIVAAGDDITYTLHFKNIGKAAATVENGDDLADVLDDADLIAGPTSSNAALTASLDAKKISIGGSVAPGQEYTVSYTVKVRDEAKRGDSVLINALAECDAIDAKLCDPIKHEVPLLGVVKSSDPASGSEVRPGQRVKYTLTFTNLQRSPKSSPAKVDYTDHMKDVLDDATLTAGPTVSNSNLTAAVIGDTITITGEMAYGQKYTVSYTVTVKDYAAQGNHVLGNVVAKTGDKPVCEPNSKLCTTHRVPSQAGLPVTGGEIAMPVVWTGLGLFGAGAIVLVLVHRQRRKLSGVHLGGIDDTM